MKELIGTEKQITWANEIRQYVTTEILKGMETADFSEKNLKNVEAIKEELQNDQSTFWIETFKCTNYEQSRLMFDYLNSKGIAGIKIAREINKNNGA